MILLFAWLRAFGVTLLVELAVVVPWLRASEQRLGRRLLIATLAQVLSHPVVWFIFPLLNLERPLFLLLAETWAVLVEVVFYRLCVPRLSNLKALAISAVANGASVTIGALLRAAGIL